MNNFIRVIMFEKQISTYVYGVNLTKLIGGYGYNKLLFLIRKENKTLYRFNQHACARNT